MFVCVLFWCLYRDLFHGLTWEKVYIYIYMRGFEVCVCLWQSLIVLSWPGVVDGMLKSNYFLSMKVQTYVIAYNMTSVGNMPHPVAVIWSCSKVGHGLRKLNWHHVVCKILDTHFSKNSFLPRVTKFDNHSLLWLPKYLSLIHISEPTRPP